MLTYLIALLLAQVPTQQAATATSAKPAATADKLVCRNEQEAHSRIPRRICLPASEWERIAKEAQDDMTRSGHDRQIVPSCDSYSC